MPQGDTAGLIHALRFAIQLAEAEGYPECAAGLRAALDRLTQSADTVAMLHKVERILYEDTAAPDEQDCGWGPLWVEVCAVLKGEANPIAEARRAAIEECARVADTEEIPKDDGTVDAGLLVEQCGAYEVVRASCVATVNSIAKRIRALASPAPQEETQ